MLLFGRLTGEPGGTALAAQRRLPQAPRRADANGGFPGISYCICMHRHDHARVNGF